MRKFLQSWIAITFIIPNLTWSNPIGVKVLDQNGSPLPGVAVVLPDTMASEKTVDSTTRYIMDQVNKQFSPQLLVVPVNSFVNFPNNDDTRHHVYSFSDAKTFELRLYHANEAEPVKFETAGIVKIGCNIHDKMRAYIVVTPHTVFGISDNEGIYQWPTLDNPPSTIELWHPQMEETLSVNMNQTDLNYFSVTLPVVPLAASSEPKKSSLEDRLKRFKRNAQ